MKLSSAGVVWAVLIHASVVYASGSEPDFGVTDKSRSLVLSDVKKQREDRYLSDYLRLKTVAFRLLSADNPAPPQSSKDTPSVVVKKSPLVLETRANPGENAAKASQTLWVRGIIPDPAGAVLDILPGDQLISVDKTTLTSYAQYLELIQSAKGDGVDAVIDRSGVSHSVQIKLCPMIRDVNIIIGGKRTGVGAYTNGRKDIFFTPEMMKFLKNDDELAFVLSHEISHIELGHYHKGAAVDILTLVPAAATSLLFTENYRDVGGIAGGLTYGVLKSPFSRDMENAADERALHYMRAAGYDLKAGEKVLRRFIVELGDDGEFDIMASHPVTTERIKRVSQISG